jgi:hypothetical protein
MKDGDFRMKQTRRILVIDGRVVYNIFILVVLRYLNAEWNKLLAKH